MFLFLAVILEHCSGLCAGGDAQYQQEYIISNCQQRFVCSWPCKFILAKNNQQELSLLDNKSVLCILEVEKLCFALSESCQQITKVKRVGSDGTPWCNHVH